MKQRGSILFFLCLLLAARFPVVAAAEPVPYFTFALSGQKAAENGEIKLRISANEMPDTAAGFRMAVSFDDARLRFVRTETSSQIKTGTMETNGAGNPIYSVYVCDVDKDRAPVLSGNIISFVFQVKEGAAVGESVIHAHIDQICNYQEQTLDLDYDEDLPFSVVPSDRPSGAAYLKSLVPVTGRLSPSFSPEVFVYAMEVPSNVSSVEFMAEAGEGGKVTVNRRSLGKAGSQTSILATVTSADGESVVQYVVLVHRAAESADSVSSTSSEKTSAGGNSSSENQKQESASPAPAPVRNNVYLSRLEPLTGALSPAFSPQIFSYHIEVPSNVSSLEFLTEASEAGAKVKVSRRTLGKAGSQTSILVTVTSADGQSESDYVVLVHRAAESGEGGVAKTTAGTGGQNSHGKTIGSGEKTNNGAPLAGERSDTGSTSAAAGVQVQQPVHNIVVIGNQMPQYLLLLLLCTNCVGIGLLVSFWLRRNRKE